jgi:hypothetical protein
MRLSKSRFVAGWQCHKYLWWRVHEPDAGELEPDIVLEDLFDQGRQVGELARERFPDGALVDLPHDDPDREAVTRAALEAGAAAVFEATFIHDNVYVAIDVLLRESDGFTLIEVKSTSSVKDAHVADAAVQAWVARESGIDVRRVEIMHLNSAYRHPGPDDLFTRTDITGRVEQLLPQVPGMVAAQFASLSGPLPDVAVGEHCWSVRECPFWDRCWPGDKHHIWTLYRAHKTARLELMRKGIHTIPQLPPGFRLNETQQRQKRAIESGTVVCERGLGAALQEFRGRLGYLDFETVARAIPVWDGVGPWRAVVVQFSYHEEQPDGSFRHEAWLAEGPHDPREELADRLLAATCGADRIVMYSAFERSRIRDLAKWLPHRAAELVALDGRLVDLLPVLQNQVYHPDFRGSFSIKNVLTPLVPELDYNDLVIVDGMTASVELARLLFIAHKVRDRDRTRRDLLAYCEQDTWAMVRLLQRLRELAAARPA